MKDHNDIDERIEAARAQLRALEAQRPVTKSAMHMDPQMERLEKLSDAIADLDERMAKYDERASAEQTFYKLVDRSTTGRIVNGEH